MSETYPIINMTLDDIPIEFSDADILECSLLLEKYPISIVLPASKASVRIFTTDPRFSIYSDGSFYHALSKHLPVEIREYWDDGEFAQTVFYGLYYLDSWKMESENILSLELVDALGVCANIDYPGSFWEVDTPFSDVVEEILSYTTIGKVIEVSVRNRLIKGWIPPSSVRDALQQVCFAARVAIKTDMETTLAFKDAVLPEQSLAGTYSTITNAEKSYEQEVTLLPQTTDFELISHDYYNLGAEAQTVDEIYSAWLEPGNYIISYPKPYWHVWGEGVGSVPIYIATEDGRVITTEDSVGVWGAPTVRVATESETFNFGSNYVSIVVDTAGQITLWGYPWLSADRPHRYREEAENPNAIIIEDAMLVNADIAPGVLDKVIEYYLLRHQTRIKVFPKIMSLSSIYKIDSFRDKKLLGIGERFEIDLTGGFLTTATFRGMEYVSG